MKKIKVAVVCGTSRDNSNSLKVARFIKEIGDEHNEIETLLVDPREILNTNKSEEIQKKWTEITTWADSFFLVVPEYNHGYPADLKKLLDSDFKNYYHKPVGIAGVSTGAFGGVRVIENLLPVLRTLGMILLSKDVQFSLVNELLDENGQIKDNNISEYVISVYEEMLFFVRKLRN
jgi:NAD(P)H-dependent FMN reductase